MKLNLFKKVFLFILGLLFLTSFTYIKSWESKFVKGNKDGKLTYIPDEKGNIFPDFSLVGYYSSRVFGFGCAWQLACIQYEQAENQN